MASSFRLYQPGDSFLYLADPRTKVIGVLVTFALSVLFSSPFILGPVLVLVVFLGLAGGIPPHQILKLMQGLAALAAISVVMWPLFFKHGEPLFQLGPFQVTDLGIGFGVAMACRILVMILASTTLMYCTTQRDLVLGLNRLGLPYKASFAFATAFRFLPTMIGVGQTILEAQRARGLELEKGALMKRLKSYAAIMAPVIIESIRVAHQLALSVEVRGFDARPHRTSLRELTYSTGDRLALVVMAILLVSTIITRSLGYGVIAAN